MLVEHQKRSSRVRFKHPVRVVTLDGQPRVIRTLTANVSHKGMFVRMPEPLPMGTRVALSLEAGGRALALAQAEVVWARVHESQLPGRFAGCGVRFTGFLHPRAEDLVGYLVDNLDRGKPLQLAPPERAAPKWLAAGAVAALTVLGLGAALVFSAPDDAELEDEVVVAQPRPEAPPIIAGAPRISPSPPGERVGVRGMEKADAPEVELTGASTQQKREEPPNSAQPLAETTKSAPRVEQKREDTPTIALSRSDEALAVAAPGGSDSKREETPKIAPPRSDEAVAVARPGGSDSKREETPKIALPRSDESVAVAPPDQSDSKRETTPKSSPPSSAAMKRDEAPASVDAKPAATKRAPAVDSVDSDDALAASVAPKALLAPTAKKSGRTGRIALPSGAASALEWEQRGTQLILSPGATVTRAFVLTNPARAVFDLSGGAPTKTTTLTANAPHVQAVRLGKQGTGTRVVVDLDELPRATKQLDGTLVLSY